MFNINIFNKFYEYDDEIEDFQVADDVKEAYFVFINDFCKLTSYAWSDYLKDLGDQSGAASFHNQLTTSDEAFTFWCIEMKSKGAEEDAKVILEKGHTEWEQTRKKRKTGYHESKVYYQQYVDCYYRVQQARLNERKYKFWQQIFFGKLFEKQNNSLVGMEIV